MRLSCSNCPRAVQFEAPLAIASRIQGPKFCFLHVETDVSLGCLQKLILNKGGVQTDLVHCPGGEGVSGEMGGDSLFFDYDCPLRTKKRDDIVLDIDWSTRAGEPAPRAQGDSWLCSPRAPLTARALAQASPRARSSLWGRPTTACRSSKTRDTPWKRWSPRLASRHRRA